MAAKKVNMPPYGWVRWALEVPLVETSPGVRLTLVALATFANANGVCWPGQKTIAKRTGAISDRSVREHLRVLEEAGVIYRQPSWKNGGGRSTDAYLLAAREGDDGQPINTLDPEFEKEWRNDDDE